MIRAKHNKKRNSAFVYEALIKEATVSILKEDFERRNKVVELIKKHFAHGTALRRDLECYRSLAENQNLDRLTCEKILKEVKIAQRLLDPSGLFKAQSAAIHDINKELSPSVFGNYVPNYKSLATIAQLFSFKVSPKEQVILENQIINDMMILTETIETQEVDSFTYTTFVAKFNDKYGAELLEEQKALLTHFISSFTDNALELKMFLNDEVNRLKSALEESRNVEEISTDSDMSDKTEKIISMLDGYKNQTINETVLLTVLKTQALVKEITADGNQS